ncbi:DUF305 domain-containing protein [Saccharothrix coeruleofusca]|uniref:DUF305 domain-containing protein n=1 Tax=Saccharothrix coeruleofusca TaxID=33919 RepID=A0A918AJK2_9PSEU|nr:DUF305 domain-containing protein [Saccharothrix coeruleofusca]MBP2338793.1 uncharacterized protein (DUF305 family) [Saccharothrix coeruleofusca]GGP45912.1 DUF305 domain-containing protein [Saccharothrix coeruleofusca]
MESRGTTTATRAVVVSVAVVAVLLLGAAVGLLIQLPGAETSSTPARDSVDVGFSQDMAEHHLQGVTMARAVAGRTADDAIRQLAFDIEATQQEQVGRMKGWLSLWGYAEQSPDGTHMAWMAGSGESHHGGTTGATGLMPGMATSEELAKLRSLAGQEFDVYFLQLMLRHHEGGAPMAEHAAKHAGQHVVRTLAENILKSQTAEGDYMKQLLGQRGAAPLP